MEDSCKCDVRGSEVIKVDPLGEKIANASLIFSTSFLILLLSLLYLLNGDGFWVGITAFSVSSILALSYIFIPEKKEKK